jgi:hypothetical protein
MSYDLTDFTPICQECGSLVAASYLDAHTAWHNRVDSAMVFTDKELKDHERAIRQAVPAWRRPRDWGPL